MMAPIGKPSFFQGLRTLEGILGLLSSLLVPLALALVFIVAPLERTLGISQKIFYFHVASAMNMMLLFGLCGLSGIFYLFLRARPSPIGLWLEAIGVACAEVGVAFGSIVLITGPLWAKKAWGTYWTWEPRLTLSLMVFLLFLAYLALRAFAGSDRFGNAVASGLAAAGLPGLYFIHFAVERWGGAHPQVIFKGGLEVPEMKIAFFASLLAMTVAAGALVVLRLKLEMAKQRLDRLFVTFDEKSGD